MDWLNICVSIVQVEGVDSAYRDDKKEREMYMTKY